MLCTVSDQCGLFSFFVSKEKRQEALIFLARLCPFLFSAVAAAHVVCCRLKKGCYSFVMKKTMSDFSVYSPKIE